MDALSNVEFMYDTMYEAITQAISHMDVDLRPFQTVVGWLNNQGRGQENIEYYTPEINQGLKSSVFNDILAISRLLAPHDLQTEATKITTPFEGNKSFTIATMKSIVRAWHEQYRFGSEVSWEDIGEWNNHFGMSPPTFGVPVWQVLDAWRNLIDTAKEFTISGKFTADLPILGDMTESGVMLGRGDGNRTIDYRGQAAERGKSLIEAATALVVPFLWSIGGDGVFLLDAKHDCSIEHPLVPQYLSQETADATQPCFKNKRYYLVSAPRGQKTFIIPPGFETFKKGIKVDDFVPNVVLADELAGGYEGLDALKAFMFDYPDRLRSRFRKRAIKAVEGGHMPVQRPGVLRIHTFDTIGDAIDGACQNLLSPRCPDWPWIPARLPFGFSGHMNFYHHGLFGLGLPRYVKCEERTRYAEKVYNGNSWDQGEMMGAELGTKMDEKPRIPITYQTQRL
ncbi:hypothetical protein OQA88_9518 [Cercophora sp. LCS_1]